MTPQKSPYDSLFHKTYLKISILSQYRNKINEQQNQVVSQQRLALAQRQAEMASIDARIAQLQGRLQRKRALNQRLSQQLGTANRPVPAQPGFQDVKHDFTNSVKQRPAGNIAAIEPYSHIPNDNDFNLNKNDPKYQTLPYNTKFTVNFKPSEDDVNKNKIQHSASASQIGQRSTFQQFGHQIAHSQSQSHIQGKSIFLHENIFMIIRILFFFLLFGSFNEQNYSFENFILYILGKEKMSLLFGAFSQTVTYSNKL